MNPSRRRPALVLSLLFALSAGASSCNPYGDTSQIDNGFLGGIYVSTGTSTLTASASSVTSGQSVALTFTARDQNGNPFIAIPPLELSFATLGGTSTGTFGTPLDNGDGTYSVSFTGVTDGTPASLVASIGGVAVTSAPPVVTVDSAGFSVTPSGTNVTIRPSAVQYVSPGSVQAFIVSASTGYTLSAAVGGTCPAGSWSGGTYTTGAVSSNCTVTFSSTLNTYSVTPSGDGNETITPNTVQTVNYNTTQAFTVTPSAGYTLSNSVGGTCPTGSWSGSIYTTGAVVGNCTVIFSAALNTYTVTPSGSHVTINPNTAQTVSYNATQAFTVTASTGYTLSAAVGGTCPAGSWSGSTYTTGAVTTNCTVSFSSTINSYAVTPSGDAHESITPNTAQTVNYGGTQAFTVASSTGYTLSATVGGTCAAGSWSGSTYTTGAITTNCTVTFSATINTYTVTPSGTNVTISPSTAQTVNYNGTQAFTVTASTGYTLSATVGGTCAAGSWSGAVYTTGAVVANCTVTFSATLNTYSVTPSGVNVSISPSTVQTVNYMLSPELMPEVERIKT
jgi:hypothetical protein